MRGHSDVRGKNRAAYMWPSASFWMVPGFCQLITALYLFVCVQRAGFIVLVVAMHSLGNVLLWVQRSLNFIGMFPFVEKPVDLTLHDASEDTATSIRGHSSICVQVLFLFLFFYRAGGHNMSHFFMVCVWLCIVFLSPAAAVCIFIVN